jgi:hypothetical protein
MGLNGIGNVHFATIELKALLDNYGSVAAPSVYIYDNDRRLSAKFNGETAIDTILSSL